MSRPTLRVVTPETTGSEQGERRDIQTRFRRGQSGNPSGRPKGSRHKLSQQFFDDLFACWEEGGPEALRRVRDEKPEAFCMLIARVLSRDAGRGSDDHPLDGTDSLEAVREFLSRFNDLDNCL